ncbi:MAG: hypothetical protein IBX48_03345 [Thiomicrospira sp.]|uniref:hypothetical protein n=1 Tax=Thiomicrospira sp. TaxID=935 RepID=UPI0019D84F14|nr:hypothetical protein [Thiomicrospira sp.]MBE0493354.1 hypothetical protein [Thiomicrospira sp.]
MASITLNHVLDALLIMLSLTAISVTIVGLLMFGLYRFFKNQKDENPNQSNKPD